MFHTAQSPSPKRSVTVSSNSLATWITSCGEGDSPVARTLRKKVVTDVSDMRGELVSAVLLALTLVGLTEKGVPAYLSLALTIGVMFLLVVGIERIVLRPLVNQPDIILFMATIGLAYFLEGLGDLMWGPNVKTLDVGLPQGLSETMESWTNSLTGYGFFIDRLDIWAAIIATALVAALVAFSQYTKQGRAMRAVADDHQAALSVGISLRFIWVMVWSIAGFVALVAGIMWGTKSGVQFSLSLIALKALPVLMLGGVLAGRCERVKYDAVVYHLPPQR